MNYHNFLHYARKHKTQLFILYLIKAALAFFISVFLGIYLYALGIKIPALFIYIFVALGVWVYVKFRKNERNGFITLKAIKKHKVLIMVISLISYAILISGSNNFMYGDTKPETRIVSFTQVSVSSFVSIAKAENTQKKGIISKVRQKIKNLTNNLLPKDSPRPYLLTLLTIFVLLFLTALLLFLAFLGIAIGCSLSCGGSEYTVALLIGYIFTSLTSIIFIILTMKWLTQLLKNNRGRK